VLAEIERRLRGLGCPKIDLQIRRDNPAAIAFYRGVGFHEDAVVSLGRRLGDPD
jgi:ribosomal protein S18 acetylase RimI-like enzyme